MEADDDIRSLLPVYEEIEQTQDYCEPNDMTMQVPSPTRLKEEKPKNNVWGSLRRKGDQEEIQLEHRNKDGKRDTYIIGRSRGADITVDDKRVSSQHCMVYCDYQGARLRVFVEDTSVNGTFVNDSLTRLHKGKRLELKTGDEIYLINPRNLEVGPSAPDKCTSFLYINLRDRLFVHRTIAPSRESHDFVVGNNSNKHVEDFYVIGDQLGSGTCGQVHMCMNRVTGEHCAVKIIDTRKFALSPGLSPTELREEAEMMRMLDHPNIIRIKDTFETDNVIFIVMELVRGGDLFDRIVEKGRYMEDAAREVMKKLLSAVSYLHANNIIHRDLKPENILLVSTSSDTDVMLTDFGLAKRANQEGLKTFCGTPQYFAPEVLKRKSTIAGAGRYGTSADMWSLGVVLYILLSGAFPFLDDENLFHQIQNAQYSVSGPEWSTISESAKHLVRSLLTLRPDQRINVQQAVHHPWIKGESIMPHIPGGTAKSGSARNLQKPKSCSGQSTDVKNKQKINSDGAPQLELTVQSSSRPPFGSCSWSHRGSQNSQNSQNSSNSQSSNSSLSPFRGQNGPEPGPEPGPAPGPDYPTIEAAVVIIDGGDDSVKVQKDGLSFFRLATGVSGAMDQPSIPIATTTAILSKSLSKPRAKRSDTLCKKTEAVDPGSQIPNNSVVKYRRSKSKSSTRPLVGSDSSSACVFATAAAAAGGVEAEDTVTMSSSRIVLSDKHRTNSKTRKSAENRTGVSAADAMELSDDGIEDFNSDNEWNEKGEKKEKGKWNGKGERKEERKEERKGERDGNDNSDASQGLHGCAETKTERERSHVPNPSAASDTAAVSRSAATSFKKQSTSSSSSSTSTSISNKSLSSASVKLVEDCSNQHESPKKAEPAKCDDSDFMDCDEGIAVRMVELNVQSPSPEINLLSLRTGIKALSTSIEIAVFDDIVSPGTASTVPTGATKRSIRAQTPPSAPKRGVSRTNTNEGGRGTKRPWHSPPLVGDDGDPQISGTRESPKRKIQAIADEKSSSKPIQSSSGTKESGKKGVPANVGKGAGPFRGSLEEAWGRTRGTKNPSTESSKEKSSSSDVNVPDSVSSKSSNGNLSSSSGSSSSSGNVGSGSGPGIVGGAGVGVGCFTRSSTVLQSSAVGPVTDLGTGHVNPHIPATISEININSMTASGISGPKSVVNTGIASVGVGKRKLRVSMTTLADIFHPAGNSVLRK